MPLEIPRNKAVTTYKGFDQSLQCRGFQFEIGKTYEHEGEVKACVSGFHSCEYPLDVFRYYSPAKSRFAVVKASGQISRHEDGNKIASSILTVEAEIGLSELASRAVDWVMSRLDKSIEQTLIHSAHPHVRTHADYSVATNTENYSEASNSGNFSAATNTGGQSAATNTGNFSAATNTGGQSVAVNTGDYSTATNTGNFSAAANTGDYSAAINTGNFSAAASTGNYSAATNTGCQSVAVNIGYLAVAEVSGSESVAASLGVQGRARASTGGAIVLCYRDTGGHLIHIRASKVGENGIEPDTWYTLDADGEFVQVT